MLCPEYESCEGAANSPSGGGSPKTPPRWRSGASQNKLPCVRASENLDGLGQDLDEPAFCFGTVKEHFYCHYLRRERRRPPRRPNLHILHRERWRPARCLNLHILRRERRRRHLQAVLWEWLS